MSTKASQNDAYDEQMRDNLDGLERTMAAFLKVQMLQHIYDLAKITGRLAQRIHDGESVEDSMIEASRLMDKVEAEAKKIADKVQTERMISQMQWGKGEEEIDA